ncbi:hypothetical protein BGZ60DRAFT_456994 [Tricladium varicosporioides]|nr:hypothetical protein BGZ60DRAFT_456994 [Hymenoscyphus varicosporioides]
MDPLSALSVAGTVVQFVQFAASLVNNVQEIHHSASGTTLAIQNVEDIHNTLSQFSKDLGDSPPNSPRYGKDLGRLAKRCKGDCDRLLKLVSQLKLESSEKKRWWKSFQLAMLELWTHRDVEDLRQRISESQASMVLVLCTISSQQVENLQNQVCLLKTSIADLKMHRTRELEDFSASLSQMESKINDIKLCTSSSPLSQDDFETLTRDVNSLAITNRNYEREYTILSSLDYKRRPARHEAIPIAHQKTFDWIFKDPSDGSLTPFSQWLKQNSGIFWISGKPGSGKSTLMKFICDHSCTLELLSTWAWPKQAISAKHYFWSAGTPIQRSQEGLLKSLTLEILRQLPEIIPSICPERWKKSPSDLRNMEWSQLQLRSCLERIATIPELPARFCFFIDGLDEFGGDHLEICESLLHLSKSTHIKMCLSSRPWNVFLDSFGQTTRHVHVHDLTRDDIRHYAQHRLHTHPKWESLITRAEASKVLAEEISNRAQGVFLWVFLVTRLLREGLTNNDSFQDLMGRLETFPSDLERFLKQILESVDPFYHPKTARMLKITVAAKEPLPSIIYAFHEMEYDDEDYALNAPVQAFEQSDFDSLVAPVPRRLRGSCKGLLEINNNCVEFLHRTVRDFLMTAEMADFLSSKIEPAIFTPSLSILRAYIAWIKHLPSTRVRQMIVEKYNRDPSSSTEVLDWTIKYARISEDENCCATECLLDMLEFSLQISFKKADPAFAAGSSEVTQTPSFVFRELVLELGIGNYVTKKLDQMPNYFSLFKVQPLHILFSRQLSWSAKRLQILQHLLELGLDPNEKVRLKGETNWTRLVGRLVGNEDDFISAIENGVFTVFLRHGANPNAILFSSDRPVWVNFLYFGLVAVCRKTGHVPRLSHEDCFVKEFETFMIQDADFSLLTKVVTFGEFGGTYWTEIQSYLREVAAMIDRLPFLYIHFLARVMKLLIQYGANSDLPWKELGPTLQECFPPSLVQPMLNIINSNDISLQGGVGMIHTRPAKRIREDDEHSSAGRAGTSTGNKLRRFP